MENNQEQGRSMVEMLGVLAIIGVLSVSGIAGYTYAMNKHRANEIIASVSKMAMTATTEIDLHGNPSLVEFKKGGKIMTDNGYEVVLEDDPNNGIFRLKVQNVPEAVCDKIINADFKLAFNVSPCASGDNEVAFSFYDSLNNNVDDTPISDTDSPSSAPVSGGTEGVTVSSPTEGVSSVPDEEPSDEPTITTTTGVPTVPTCTSDSMCQSGLFCQKQCNSDDYSKYDMNPGMCLSDSDATAQEKEYNNKYYVLSSKKMTHDQAIRWCKKQNVRDWNASTTHKGELVTISDLGFGSLSGFCDWTSCAAQGGGTMTSQSLENMRTAFGSFTYFWTTNIVPLQSCYAFVVDIYGGEVYYASRDYDDYALCK